MDTNNTSEFEVKNSKKQKRKKEKHKSNEFTNKANNKTDISEEVVSKTEDDKQHILHKKAKGKKHKLNNSGILNDNHKEPTECNAGKNKIAKVKKKPNKEVLDDEAVPPKKKPNNTDTSNDVDEADDTEETRTTDSKGSKKPSKRQMKREKAEIKENEKRMASKMETTKKGLNYVSKWKYARSEWKFEKLRQIWLMDNLLDQTSIPDDIFPTVLEYFEGCKGMAREQLLKKGMDIIRKVEENEENEEHKNDVESVAYQRARKLLQALPTDT